MDCHFVRGKVQSKTIITPYVKTEDQLADFFTKSIGRDRLRHTLVKLGIVDISAPTFGSVGSSNVPLFIPFLFEWLWFLFKYE